MSNPSLLGSSLSFSWPFFQIYLVAPSSVKSSFLSLLLFVPHLATTLFLSLSPYLFCCPTCISTFIWSLTISFPSCSLSLSHSCSCSVGLSFPLSLSLSLSLSLFLNLSVSVSQSLCFYLCISLSPFLSLPSLYSVFFSSSY